MTIRWAAGVEYLGSGYSGWQTQTHAPSVQAVLQAALSAVAAHAVEAVAAGRTDAGVHALGQVIHFDSPAPRSPYAWLLGTNSQLPPDVSLRWVQAVPGDFHARFSARARSYRYVIHNSRARSALVAARATWSIYPLDAERMHRAAQVLVGEHDFSAFRDSQCQSTTPVRDLQRIEVRRRGEFIVIEVTANAFLHHMVRNIAGTLITVGQGRQPEAWVGQVLHSRRRSEAGVTAEPQGLYFIGPQYPAEFGLPPPPDPWFPPP